MQKRIEALKQKYDEALERHRDAYNQALGGLHVIDELLKPVPDALTEEQVERMVGGQILSFDPVSEDGKNG